MRKKMRALNSPLLRALAVTICLSWRCWRPGGSALLERFADRVKPRVVDAVANLGRGLRLFGDFAGVDGSGGTQGFFEQRPDDGGRIFAHECGVDQVGKALGPAPGVRRVEQLEDLWGVEP